MHFSSLDLTTISLNEIENSRTKTLGSCSVGNKF